MGTPSGEDFVFIDVDDTIVEVQGYQKQGSGYGYSGVRGLKAVLATASTKDAAPVIIGQRLRKGAANLARGAKRFVMDALATLKRTNVAGLCRFDSVYYGHATVSAAVAGGAGASVTVRMDPAIKRAITAFSSRKRCKRITGRLVVLRIPELNPKATDGQPTLFDTHRYQAFFTIVPAGTLGTVEADKIHRQHAQIEQVIADMKDSALARLPSGKFAANSAWLVAAVMAYNLTRAAGVLAKATFAKAWTGTIRAKLINVPARVASSARRIRFHLPESWPWQTAWEQLFAATHAPPQTT